MAAERVITHWLVRLDGAPHDLAELPAVLQFPAARVALQDGHYYLESTALDHIQDPQQALAASRHLLQTLNGAARLHFDHWSNVKLANALIGIDAQGGRHPFGFGFGTGRRVNTRYPHPARVRAWVERAARDERASDALRFFADPTWMSLYKVYEIIRQDVGDMAAAGWAKRGEIRAFTQTAQSAEALGDAARHAASKFAPPDTPMTHSDAVTLLRSILQRWLASRDDEAGEQT